MGSCGGGEATARGGTVMAQIVGYFENFHTEERRAEAFSEGPFVIVNANGWRIECELGQHHCPVLPDVTVYDLRKSLGYELGKFWEKERAATLCDHLNMLVKEDRIVKHAKGFWYCPEFERESEEE